VTFTGSVGRGDDHLGWSLGGVRGLNTDIGSTHQ